MYVCKNVCIYMENTSTIHMCIFVCIVYLRPVLLKKKKILKLELEKQTSRKPSNISIA